MNDAIGITGFVAMVAGVYGRYGWEFAAILGGVTLLALTVIGAMRR
jgi:hypothetical protein